MSLISFAIWSNMAGDVRRGGESREGAQMKSIEVKWEKFLAALRRLQVSRAAGPDWD